MSLRRDTQPEDAHAGSAEAEEGGGAKTAQLESGEEEEMVKSAAMEASTLQWPGDRQAGGQTGKGDRASVRSDGSLREAASWTESERELMAERERKGGGGASEEEGPGLRTHLEKELEELEENQLPEKAAQVFSPAVTVLPSPSSPRESEAFWELESERGPFLTSGAPQDYNQHGYQYEWATERPPASSGRGCPGREVLKIGVSLVTSALFFPFLVWGGFVFLPFDAPLLNSAPLRLVYTLRCSVFAAAPIVLGWLVLGFSRLRYGVVRPLFEDPSKEAHFQEVAVHRRFVSDSASLFLVYFLQLVVMAVYLSQEQLKLIPLLTIVFALGRLVYWVAAAFGSSVRGFGFGLSFLPSVAMMFANFYFIFAVEAAGSIFSRPPPPEALAPPPGKQSPDNRTGVSMESVGVRRKSCLLRLRDNCPFRKLRRHANDVSAETSTPTGSCWNNRGPPTSRTVYSEPLPPRHSGGSVQSEAAADIDMEEEGAAAENRQHAEDRADDCMDLDDVDPETGERAQG